MSSVPKILTRIDLENRFIKDWTDMRVGFADEFIDQLGSPPTPSGIDPQFWQDVRVNHEAVANEHTHDIFTRSASAIAETTVAIAGLAIAYSADSALNMGQSGFQ